MYAKWSLVQDASTSLITTGHKQILGLNTTNRSGGSPAHILDTSLISGLDKSILELRNNANTKFRVDSEGGVHTDRLVLGGYFLFVDTAGNLRIKSSSPTNATDGTVVGTQA
jgi:hypothetical protein